jgi:hypothetical protein
LSFKYSSDGFVIVPSTVIIGLFTICPNVKLLDDYKLNYSHPTNIKLCKKQINLLIIYLSNKALELLNGDLKSNLITKYLETNTIVINFIEPKVLEQMVGNMTAYYNLRNMDGWKESNKQIPMTNTNYINVSQPLNPNDFNNLLEWCPLDGQKMLGSQWDKVWSIIDKSDILEINKFLAHEISQVDIITECKIVLDKSLNLTDNEKITAEFWAGIGGSVTPPGFFNMFLIGYFKSNCAKSRK